MAGERFANDGKAAEIAAGGATRDAAVSSDFVDHAAFMALEALQAVVDRADRSGRLMQRASDAVALARAVTTAAQNLTDEKCPSAVESAVVELGLRAVDVLETFETSRSQRT